MRNVLQQHEESGKGKVNVVYNNDILAYFSNVEKRMWRRGVTGVPESSSCSPALGSLLAWEMFGDFLSLLMRMGEGPF